MRGLRAAYFRFRGFEQLQIEPRGHVLLLGEPRAGRSDALEGLSRVLGWGGQRIEEPDVLDFHMRDTSARAEVEIVLGDLGPEIEQLFWDKLEFWDSERNELIEELESPVRNRELMSRGGRKGRRFSNVLVATCVDA